MGRERERISSSCGPLPYLWQACKKAEFESGERQGSRRVVTMTLLDQIQENKKTVIDYQDVAPYELADKYYNPAYLSKNKRVEL